MDNQHFNCVDDFHLTNPLPYVTRKTMIAATHQMCRVLYTICTQRAVSPLRVRLSIHQGGGQEQYEKK